MKLYKAYNQLNPPPSSNLRYQPFIGKFKIGKKYIVKLQLTEKLITELFSPRGEQKPQSVDEKLFLLAFASSVIDLPG
ncbi:hypothetical protein HK096_001528, partial [Nowakowskiella sp. JEL0078]